MSRVLGGSRNLLGLEGSCGWKVYGLNSSLCNFLKDIGIYIIFARSSAMSKPGPAPPHHLKNTAPPVSLPPPYRLPTASPPHIVTLPPKPTNPTHILQSISAPQTHPPHHQHASRAPTPGLNHKPSTTSSRIRKTDQLAASHDIQLGDGVRCASWVSTCYILCVWKSAGCLATLWFCEMDIFCSSRACGGVGSTASMGSGEGEG